MQMDSGPNTTDDSSTVPKTLLTDPATRCGEALRAVSVGWRKTLLGSLLSIATGVMLVVSWPSLGNLWWLVFFAFVPMLVAQYRFMPRRLAGLPVGLAFGCYWAGGLEMASAPVGIWPVIGATIVIGLLGWLIGAFDKRFAERTRYRWFAVQFALIWVGIDVLLDGNLFSGSMSWIAYRLWMLPRSCSPSVSLARRP